MKAVGNENFCERFNIAREEGERLGFQFKENGEGRLLYREPSDAAWREFTLSSLEASVIEWQVITQQHNLR